MTKASNTTPKQSSASTNASQTQNQTQNQTLTVESNTSNTSNTTTNSSPSARHNRSLGNPSTFPLTRNRTLTISGKTLTLNSNLHKAITWDVNNVTITFDKEKDRCIKIHSSSTTTQTNKDETRGSIVGNFTKGIFTKSQPTTTTPTISSSTPGGVSREVRFRSSSACASFKGRWESEVTRRRNTDFIMICVYGCVGLRSRTGRNNGVKGSTDVGGGEEDEVKLISSVGLDEDKGRKKSSGFLGIRSRITAAKSSSSLKTPPPTPPPAHARTPSVALQDAVSSTLTTLNTPSKRHRGPSGPTSYVTVSWGDQTQGFGGVWETDPVRYNCNPIWTGIGGGEIVLHRESAGVDGGPIFVSVYDDAGLVDTIQLKVETGLGRVVHPLGDCGGLGCVAVEVKVPSGQEMEDGRRTRQWKLDHCSRTTQVLRRVERETVQILKTMVQTASPVPNDRWSKRKGEREFKIKPWLTDKQIEGREENTWWTKVGLWSDIRRENNSNRSLTPPLPSPSPPLSPFRPNSRTPSTSRRLRFSPPPPPQPWKPAAPS